LKNRLEILKQFVAENPSDALSRYGLAMEYASQGQNEEALTHFRQLMETHPGYAAGYYQWANLLLRLGRREEARKIIETGLDVTRRSGDMHAFSELQALLSDAD
jgi:tetratricopeptide (TPR) repeat protein